MSATKTKAGVTIARADLAAALRTLGAIKAKAVHIDPSGDTVRLSGYVSEVGVTVDTGIEGEGDAVAVPRPALAALLPYCDSEVHLTTSETELTIESGCSTFELRTLRVDALGNGTFSHKDPADIEGPAVGFEAPTLAEVLRRALPHVSRDCTRPVLTGLALYPASNIAAATDSYRLAIVRYGDESKDDKDEVPFAVERSACEAIRRGIIKKLGTVTLRQDDTHIAVEFGNVSWSVSRVVRGTAERPGGSFPNWRQLLPDAKDATTILRVDRDDLTSAARASKAITGGGPTPLQLTLNGNARVTSKHFDRGKMDRTLPSADVSGGNVEIGLNPDFIADICVSSPVERPTIRIIGPLRPVLIEAGRDTYLLMPVRLNA